MPVPTEVSRKEYAANGATDTFPTGFVFFDEEHLVVVLIDAADNATAQELGVDYEVTGGAGEVGSVVFGTAPDVGLTVRIERDVPITQDVDFRTAGEFSAETHTDRFDYQTEIDQQLQRQIDDLNSLGSLIPASDYSAVLIDKTFTTDADDIEATFPLSLVLPAGLVPTGVLVAKVINNDDADALLKEAVFAHWKYEVSFLSLPAVYTVILRYITGLEPGTEYTITFEVLQEPVS